MYAPQLPPPPYQQQQQMDNYFRPAEERMADFQQLVGRYESMSISRRKKQDFLSFFSLMN